VACEGLAFVWQGGIDRSQQKKTRRVLLSPHTRKRERTATRYFDWNGISERNGLSLKGGTEKGSLKKR